jgi:hypothetical protein
MDFVCILILVIFMVLVIRIEQVVTAFDYNANHLSYLIEKTVVILLLATAKIIDTYQLFVKTYAQINLYTNKTVETLVD